MNMLHKANEQKKKFKDNQKRLNKKRIQKAEPLVKTKSNTDMQQKIDAKLEQED